MKIILVILLTFTASAAFAQHNFQNGYIVNLSGDTVRGAIDHKEWGDRPVEILFKNTADGNNTTYTSKQVKYFEISGKVAYRSYAGYITNDTDRDTEVGGLDTSKVFINAFLNYVRKGQIISLLKYYDSKKTRYFVEDEKTHVITELVQYLYANGGSLTIHSLKRYKKQLYDIADANNALTTTLQHRIESTNYNDDNLLNVVTEINRTDKNKLVITKKSKPIRFFVGAALNIASAKYVGANVLASNVIREGSSLPKITAGIDLFRNPDVGKLVFRFELSLTQTSFRFRTDEGPGPINNYKQIITTLAPQVIYNFYNTKNTKAYLGAGAGLNYAVYKDVYFARAYEDTHIKQIGRDAALNSFFLTIPFRAGVLINKHFELSVIYAPSYRPNRQYSIVSTFIQPGINYHFK